MPPKEKLAVIGCREFHESAAEQADKFITLVKDTKHYLPLTPEKYKRVKLVFIGGVFTAPVVPCSPIRPGRLMGPFQFRFRA